MKRRCCVCHLMAENWQRANGSGWHCYDGCYSTTGYDRRSEDGEPIWLRKDEPMTKEQLDAIPRKQAHELLALIPAGRGYDDRVLLAIEQAMNLEWWRGYHAAKSPQGSAE